MLSLRQKFLLFMLIFSIVGFGFAHDYTIPGGDPPAPQPPAPPAPPPPCDPTPPDTCPLPNSSKSGSGKEPCTGGEPVYLFDGSFYYRHTDLNIPGKIPIVIQRAYDTRIEFKGLFGYGWSMNYHVRLRPLSNGHLLLKNGDNSKTEFLPYGGNRFKAEDKYAFITANVDGTFTFDQSNGYFYNFDINGCLESIYDKNGNQLLFSYVESGGIKQLLPFSSISPYAMVNTPIIIGYDYQLSRISEAHEGVLSGRYINFVYNASGRIERIEDSSGRQVVYEYSEDNRGDLIRMTDPENNIYEYHYNPEHLMTSFYGLGCGDCTLHVNTYNENGQVIRQTHGSLVKEFEYLPDYNTKVTTYIYNDQTHELLNTRYEYYHFDAEGYTQKFTRQLGQELDEAVGSTETDDVVQIFVYDTDKNIIQKTNPMGVVTDYTYDSVTGYKLTEKVNIPDSSGYILTSYTYNPNHHQYDSITITSTIDPNVYLTEYTYDENGNIASETTYADSSVSASAITTRYTYDENGRILTRTDPMVTVTAKEYDSYGNLSREYDPDNPSYQTLYTYDSNGNLLSVTDARNNTTTYEYDNLGRMLKTTNPLGIQTVYTYSGPNLVQVEQGKTETEPGRITQYEYDGLNRKIKIKLLADPNDSGSAVTVASYTYDSEGNILVVKDANGNSSTSQYDVLGRIVSVKDALGNKILYAYNAADNRILTTDAEGNTTAYEYDYANHLISTTNALKDTTRYTYNAIGKVLTVTDARSNTYTHTYDNMGRLLSFADPNGHTETYAYDKNDNMTKNIVPNEYADPTGVDPIVYAYDKYSQLKKVDYPDGKTVIYTYDLVGNMLSWDDGTLSESITYDELNRKTSVTTHYPNFSKTVSYTYNRFGQKEAMTDGEGQLTAYSYDHFGQMTEIAHPNDLTTYYVYDPAGRLTKKTLPNGVNTDYIYGAAGNLLSLVNKKPDMTVISSFVYTYDKVGNRLTMTTLDGTHTYTYDDIYQLTAADHPDGFPFADEVYTYDPVGNRLTSAEFNDWTYDKSNRLLSYGSTTFTYDNNGNTISKTDSHGSTTYNYDYDNRMMAAFTPEHNSSYIYSPRGNRLCKTVDANSIWFHYDNEDIIAEYNNSGSIQTQYKHGRGIDDPLTISKNKEVYCYIFDGLGSVSEVTSSDGDFVESYNYDCFGTLSTTPLIGSPYTYTSREYDNSTNNYFYRNRYYTSLVGRFVSIDRIRFAGGINFYAYVRNNPINFIDADGLLTKTPGNLICRTECSIVCTPIKCFGWIVGEICKKICREVCEDPLDCHFTKYHEGNCTITCQQCLGQSTPICDKICVGE